MVRASIKEADALQRKSYVDPADRTAYRDEVADWLEYELVDGDRSWPESTLTELAEDAKCSREHISRVLDTYFEPQSNSQVSDIEHLADVLSEEDRGSDAQTAYRDGAMDMLSYILENPQIIAPLLDDRR